MLHFHIPFVIVYGSRGTSKGWAHLDSDSEIVKCSFFICFIYQWGSVAGDVCYPHTYEMPYTTNVLLVALFKCGRKTKYLISGFVQVR
jgi:hypothetical protein